MIDPRELAAHFVKLLPEDKEAPRSLLKEFKGIEHVELTWSIPPSGHLIISFYDNGSCSWWTWDVNNPFPFKEYYTYIDKEILRMIPDKE